MCVTYENTEKRLITFKLAGKNELLVTFTLHFSDIYERVHIKKKVKRRKFNAT